MSSAARIPPLQRALASIRYAEIVADLLAGVVVIERIRAADPKALGPEWARGADALLLQNSNRLRVLLSECTKFKEDFKVDIEGLDFQKVARRVRQACGDEPSSP